MKRTDFLSKTRQTLLTRRAALRRWLKGELALLSRSEEVGDRWDEALDTDPSEVLSQLAQYDSRELAAIENALARMRRGHYGLCEECGRNISVTRLQALPHATLCIQCQRNIERQPQFRNSSNRNRPNLRDARTDANSHRSKQQSLSSRASLGRSA